MRRISVAARAPASVALTALLVVVTSCARNAGVETGPMSGWGDPGPDSFSGTVRVVGNQPFERTLVDSDGDGVFVSGELEPEIRRLTGAEVSVSGRFTEGDQPGRYIEASSYEVLSIGGVQPVVGVLDQSTGGYYLDLFDGGTYTIRALTPDLMAAVGAKIWVEADEHGNVRRYGFLSRPPSP